jgi:hypothetical protein
MSKHEHDDLFRAMCYLENIDERTHRDDAETLAIAAHTLIQRYVYKHAEVNDEMVNCAEFICADKMDGSELEEKQQKVIEVLRRVGGWANSLIFVTFGSNVNTPRSIKLRPYVETERFSHANSPFTHAHFRLRSKSSRYFESLEK